MTDADVQAFFNDFENGAPTPPVDPEDIRCMWEFTSKVRKEHPPTDTGTMLRSVRAPSSIPEASLGPICVRTGLLDTLVRLGALKPWTPGTEYEQRVFEVAASFPVKVGKFDSEEFVRQAGEERPGV